MGDPYATPRRQNVVTPWSKKHPDGGSATAQRTDSVTCNAIPSAQVAHSTLQSDLSEPRIRAAVTGNAQNSVRSRQFIGIDGHSGMRNSNKAQIAK